MRKTDLAYLAGVLDSDGYITVNRTTRNKAGGRKQVCHTAKVGIAGTRRQPHDFAASLFGGSVFAYEPKNPAHRTQFQWQVSGRMAVPILRSVRPFLLIKGPQADLAIELQKLIAKQNAEMRATQTVPYRITDEMAAARDVVLEAVRALNQDRRAAYRKCAAASNTSEGDTL